jgi:hypothetical protein
VLVAAALFALLALLLAPALPVGTLGALLAAEAAFYALWYRRRYAELDALPGAKRAPSTADATRLFERFLAMRRELPDAYGSVQAYITCVLFVSVVFVCLARARVPRQRNRSPPTHSPKHNAAPLFAHPKTPIPPKGCGSSARRSTRSSAATSRS